MTGNIVAPKTWKIVLKLILVVVLTLNSILAAIGIIASIGERYDFTKDDIPRMLDQCNELYYKRKFGELKDHLTLYELYDEQFDKYWEICDAYEAYMDHVIYKNTEEDETLPLERLTEIMNSTKYPDNRKVIEGFISEING